MKIRLIKTIGTSAGRKAKTGWDLGKASPSITEYMEQYTNQNAAILIPGCSNGYEAEFLIENGFTNITLIDIATKAVELLNERFVNKPQVKVINEDFFQHKGNYDLIIEQTFFLCHSTYSKKKSMPKKTASLLNENGKVIGVLFDHQFNQTFPPFGGCPCEYKPLFEPYFTIKNYGRMLQ